MGLPLTHLDPDSRQQLTTKTTTVCILCESTIILLHLAVKPSSSMNKNNRLTTDESASIVLPPCQGINITNAETDVQSDCLNPMSATQHNEFSVQYTPLVAYW